MARVLLACELGQGDDHVRRALPLALALRARGHEPVLALGDLPKVEPALAPHGLRLLQAPVWRARVGGLPPVHTYTDLMLRHGFVNAQGLRALARGWRDLVQLVQPALVLADHAPVALFATRGLGVPRLRCGDGFSCPPLATPMPPMTWWDARPEPFDTIGERNVVHVANQAAADLGLPAAASVAELLHAEADAVCTLPELDPYPGRTGTDCCGALAPAVEGAATPWPEGETASAFVALPANHPLLEPLVQALQAAGRRAVLQIAGCGPELAARLTAPGIVVARTPVPVAQVLRHAAHAVVDGHTAITQVLLRAGKPLLMLPTLLEQVMLARRVEQLGAGLRLEGEAPDLAAALWRLSADAGLATAARAFAERHRDTDDSRTLEAVVARAEALLAPH